MKYFLLHNRRHLGPYSLQQLQELTTNKTIPAQAYVVSEENAELGKLNYQKLADIVDVRSSAPKASVNASSRRVMSLPEKEIRFLEKTFNEAVDPLDLVESPGVSARESAAASLPPDVSISARWLGRWREVPRSYLYAGVFLLGGLFLFKGFVGVQGERSEVPSAQDRAPARSPLRQDREYSGGRVRGGSLSENMRLGPAMPRSAEPTIRVPNLRSPTTVQQNDVIDVEANTEQQGAPPEGNLIKRKIGKRKKPVDENSGEEGVEYDENGEVREPANEDDAYEDPSVEEENVNDEDEGPPTDEDY